MKIQPLILCGGSGTRLWPLSRSTYPKQLLAPFGGHSLLQETLLRFTGDQYEAPLVICHEDHRFLVAEQLQQLGLKEARIVLEPCSRNTAAAIALGALFCNPDQALLVTPSDHRFEKAEAFHACVNEAQKVDSGQNIVVFGIQPTAPKTGYGYILRKKNSLDVEQFVEKPDETKAQSLLTQHALWNSGLFYAKSSTLLHEIQTHMPQTYDHVQKAHKGAKKDLDFIRVDQQAFRQCENISIDYGVIEKSISVRCVACVDVGWSDVGSWETIWDLSPKDQNHNVMLGDVVTQDVEGSYLRSDGVLLSVLGLKDVVVVATPDAVLVADKSQSEAIRGITTQLKNQSRSEMEQHKRVYRPWGYYQEIEIGDRFKVKRLMVKPQSKTSVQIHHHRSEHWVVVSGTASVLVGEETRLVHENESVYIPAGVQHAIENPGKIDLHFIEVQSGSYLGEDDIIRLQDLYGRAV